MKRYKLRPLLLLVLLGSVTACGQGPRPLDVTIHRDYLCVFTNNPKTYYGVDNTFLIYMGEIDYSKEFKTDYEKLYTNAPLPIKEVNCVKIPLNEIKKNVAYEIVLDTNKSFHASVCVVDVNNKLYIKNVEPGESSCE